MKTTFTRIFGLFGLTLLLSASTYQEAQAQDFSGLVKAHPDDAETLLGNYLEPAFTGFGMGIANGWYNTAAPHKFPGFDLTITGNLVTVPADGQFFNFSSAEYSGRVTSSANELPTIFGPDDSEPSLQLDYTREYNGQSYRISETVNGLSGLGFNMVPVPVAQLGIGLPKNTDLKVRFIPSFAVGDLSLGLWGVGVMHDFKQWIPGLKALPFDASVFVGYTKFEAANNFATPDNASFTTDGEGVISSSALTYQLLVSKKLSVLTVYAGLGANSINSNLKMLGTYYVEGENEVSGEVEQIELEKDPINLEFSAGGARATIGARLKLAIITLHADYTLQKYNTVSAGIGISVR